MKSYHYFFFFFLFFHKATAINTHTYALRKRPSRGGVFGSGSWCQGRIS